MQILIWTKQYKKAEQGCVYLIFSLTATQVTTISLSSELLQFHYRVKKMTNINHNLVWKYNKGMTDLEKRHLEKRFRLEQNPTN